MRSVVKGHGCTRQSRQRASRVIGIDNSAEVPDVGLTTAENAEIRRGNVMVLDQWLDAISFIPEVIVAGELIEHLPSPLAFLESIVRMERLRGATLILTTPNATAAHNVAIGLLSRESTHHDHLCILSFKTLNKGCVAGRGSNNGRSCRIGPRSQRCEPAIGACVASPWRPARRPTWPSGCFPC